MTGKPWLVSVAILLAAIAGFLAGRESMRREIRKVLTSAPSPLPVPSDLPSAPRPRLAKGWQLRADTSAMDDSKTVTMSLEADSALTGWIGRPMLPTLIIRCKEHKTDFYIINGTSANVEYGLNDQATIRLRLDADAPVDLVWNESTDDEALFAPNPIPLAKGIVRGTRLTYEFTPFRSSPAQFAFTIAGMQAPLGEVAGACGWKL
jgi:hypothetical protein